MFNNQTMPSKLSAVVHIARAGLSKLWIYNGVTLIKVVRRQEQVKNRRRPSLSSSKRNFKNEIRRITYKLKSTTTEGRIDMTHAVMSLAMAS